jgi:hypothetical protein
VLRRPGSKRCGLPREPVRVGEGSSISTVLGVTLLVKRFRPTLPAVLLALALHVPLAFAILQVTSMGNADCRRCSPLGSSDAGSPAPNPPLPDSHARP